MTRWQRRCHRWSTIDLIHKRCRIDRAMVVDRRFVTMWMDNSVGISIKGISFFIISISLWIRLGSCVAAMFCRSSTTHRFNTVSDCELMCLPRKWIYHLYCLHDSKTDCTYIFGSFIQFLSHCTHRFRYACIVCRRRWCLFGLSSIVIRRRWNRRSCIKSWSTMWCCWTSSMSRRDNLSTRCFLFSMLQSDCWRFLSPSLSHSLLY